MFRVKDKAKSTALNVESQGSQAPDGLQSMGSQKVRYD